MNDNNLGLPEIMFRMTANKIECLVVMQIDEFQMSGSITHTYTHCDRKYVDRSSLAKPPIAIHTLHLCDPNQYHVTYNPHSQPLTD